MATISKNGLIVTCCGSPLNPTPALRWYERLDRSYGLQQKSVCAVCGLEAWQFIPSVLERDEIDAQKNEHESPQEGEG